MRKVLLTVMMVSSLLAFNACKKDGAVGPAGPAGANGATGATGPAGAVGAAGAKGADGTKIYGGTVDPTTEGAVGDYYFNKTTKTLWGPKVAAGWAGTSTTLTGPAGSKFLGGAVAPTATTPSNAVEGDYYFDTTTSTFYGPKAADGSWAGTVVLNSGAAAKNSVFTKGFDVASIVEAVGARTTGQKITPSYSDYTLFTTFKILPQDLVRLAQYPGWITNREMMFETFPGSNDFSAPLSSVGQINTGNFLLNAAFKYKNDPVNQAFNFTQIDIDRLNSAGATSFGYFNFAAIKDVTLGADITFARKKNFTISTDATKFATSYTATTKFDMNTLPGIASIEDVKASGKLFAKYKYFSQKTATGGNTAINVANNTAGWSEVNGWANGYIGTTGGYNVTSGINPFDGNAAYGAPAIASFMGSGTYFGNGGVATFANGGNTAVGVMDLTATVTNRGKFTVNWTITSGVAAPAVAHAVGDVYYNSAAGNLTQTSTTGTVTAVVGNSIIYDDSNGGLEPAALGAIKLVQINVLAIPAVSVNAAKAKGVDINNANALMNFIKL